MSEWIPLKERLPENFSTVIVTWKNNVPAAYYAKIKGKPFVGAAIYFRGEWYWYSAVTEDLLAEYGRCPSEKMDGIEVVAWMPLPEHYKEAEE